MNRYNYFYTYCNNKYVNFVLFILFIFSLLLITKGEECGVFSLFFGEITLLSFTFMYDIKIVQFRLTRKSLWLMRPTVVTIDSIFYILLRHGGLTV